MPYMMHNLINTLQYVWTRTSLFTWTFTSYILQKTSPKIVHGIPSLPATYTWKVVRVLAAWQPSLVWSWHFLVRRLPYVQKPSTHQNFIITFFTKFERVKISMFHNNVHKRYTVNIKFANVTTTAPTRASSLCIVLSVLSLALFCTPPPLRVLTNQRRG